MPVTRRVERAGGEADEVERAAKLQPALLVEQGNHRRAGERGQREAVREHLCKGGHACRALGNARARGGGAQARLEELGSFVGGEVARHGGDRPPHRRRVNRKFEKGRGLGFLAPAVSSRAVVGLRAVGRLVTAGGAARWAWSPLLRGRGGT